MQSSKQQNNWISELETIASGVAISAGCELYDIEMIGLGGGRTLQVFIDKESGIGIEDCSAVSKGLNEILDDKDLIPGGAYHLEVSSPGLDRHLRYKRHFEKVVGRKIFIQLKQNLGLLGVEEKSLQAMKKFEQVLEKIDGESLVFDIKGIEIKVPLDMVEKSKLVFEMKMASNGKPGKSNKGNK